MPSIGHLAVGLCVARFRPSPPRIPAPVWVAGFVFLSFAPDLDVIAFRLGIPYAAPWGHRGAVHSPGFALLCGAVLAILAITFRLPALRIGITAALVMATHGVLDAFTDGGRGIALLWPFSNARLFAPVQPIPVAPIGLDIFSKWGLRVILAEIAIFLPLILLALWPRSRKA